MLCAGLVFPAAFEWHGGLFFLGLAAHSNIGLCLIRWTRI